MARRGDGLVLREDLAGFPAPKPDFLDTDFTQSKKQVLGGGRQVVPEGGLEPPRWVTIARF
jgi:hypothetical protein